jgi:hypothetical protein
VADDRGEPLVLAASDVAALHRMIPVATMPTVRVLLVRVDPPAAPTSHTEGTTTARSVRLGRVQCPVQHAPLLRLRVLRAADVRLAAEALALLAELERGSKP